MSIKILSTSRDMVGDLATIRAEIYEQCAGYVRVKEIIEIEIAGGARMSDNQLISKIEEIYYDQ